VQGLGFEEPHICLQASGITMGCEENEVRGLIAYLRHAGRVALGPAACGSAVDMVLGEPVTCICTPWCQLLSSHCNSCC